MKKHILLGTMCLGALAFTSCTQDYTDWASPQATSQEASAAAYGVTISGQSITESVALQGDSVDVAIFSTSHAEITGYKVVTATLNGTAISLGTNGNALRAKTSELIGAITTEKEQRNYGTYTGTLDFQFDAITHGKDAVYLTGSTTVSVNKDKVETPDANGYFILGDVQGADWNPPFENRIDMAKISDGIYQATVTTTGDNNYIKMYGQTGRMNPAESGDPKWDDINPGAVGCAKDGDVSLTGVAVLANDNAFPNGAQSICIQGAGTWKIILDMNAGKYSIVSSKLASTYYYVGSASEMNKYQFKNASGKSITEDPVLTCIVPTESGWHWFKICNAEAFYSSTNYINWSYAEDHCIVAAENNDSNTEGSFVFGYVGGNSWHIDPLPATSYIKITINVLKMTYKWEGVDSNE